jgi:hypothetical protein
LPITEFQKKVFQTLKTSRDPESYVAGGTAINRNDDSLRYSQDIDLFHDTDLAVVSAYKKDLNTLRKARYQCDTLISQPSFYQVIASKENESIKLEWVRDTAFRYFPVVEDEQMGYRLHDVDLAINKCIALANRTEIRDAIDIVQLSSSVLSLSACCWASCGKDPGFTPDLILECIQRNSIFNPAILEAESLRKPIDPVELKKDLWHLINEAKSALAKLPSEDLGCLYLDSKGRVVKNPDSKKIEDYTRHYGSIRGSWPRVGR